MTSIENEAAARPASSNFSATKAWVRALELTAPIVNNPQRKIALLVSAVPLALFANIIRVTGIGVLAHFYGSKAALDFLHDFSGGVVFMFGFILLFLEFQLLTRNDK